MAISSAIAARGRVTRNTEPHSKRSSRKPETSGPRLAMAPPSADQSAIDLVRAGPAQRAVMRARVVGYAMPADRPPRSRAAMRTSMVGANAASRHAGIDSATPRMSMSLRPYRSPRAPSHSTDAASPRE
jgi:hypothetical protein